MGEKWGQLLSRKLTRKRENDYWEPKIVAPHFSSEVVGDQPEKTKGAKMERSI